MSLGVIWRDIFLKTLHQPVYLQPFKEAGEREHLGDWTEALTNSVVASCHEMGWDAVGLGHSSSLPIARYEYLSMDVMAFNLSGARWQFPTAVMELENDLSNEKSAYCLWKVLCVRAALRVVICYRRTSQEASSLVRYLSLEVIGAIPLYERTTWGGETIVAVGNAYYETSTFPYSYFKWWQLNWNTGDFYLMS